MHAQHKSFRLQHGGCRDPTDTTVPAPPSPYAKQDSQGRAGWSQGALDRLPSETTKRCARPGCERASCSSSAAARIGAVCAEDLSRLWYGKPVGSGSLMMCYTRPHASNNNTRGVGGLQNAGWHVPPAAWQRRATVRKSRRIPSRPRLPLVASSYTATRPPHPFVPTLFFLFFHAGSADGNRTGGTRQRGPIFNACKFTSIPYSGPQMSQ